MNGEQDFRDLTRLLSLKRHEQPPPGYFNRFSREVIVKIKAEAAESREPRPGWLQRFWMALETKPIAAGSFGAAVCGLMLGGLIFSDGVDPGLNNMPQVGFAPGYQAASDIRTSLEPGLPAMPFAHLIGSNMLPSQTSPSLFNVPGIQTHPAGDPRYIPQYNE